MGCPPSPGKRRQVSEPRARPVVWDKRGDEALRVESQVTSLQALTCKNGQEPSFCSQEPPFYSTFVSIKRNSA